MLRKTALFFSIILHPILMPLIGVTILLYSGSFISFVPLQTKKVIILIFITGTLILPLFMMILFWFRGIIGDLHLDEKSERVLPYVMTFIFYLFTYLLLQRIPAYQFMRSFLLAGLISLLLLLLLNIKWKISAHMTGIGGISALLLAVSIKLQINLLPLFILAILASGILGTARLILNAHKPSEVFAGFMLGFVVMAGVLF